MIRRVPIDLVLLPLLLVVIVWLGQRSIAGAIPIPVSDESLHVSRLLDLERALSRVHNDADRAAVLLFSGDSYPNGLYTASLPVIRHVRSIDGARLTLVGFALAHAIAAVTLGRRLWGGAGAWAYAVMVCLAPVALVYLRFYLLDVPLIATVGVAVLAVEASEGFRRPIPTLIFVLAAAVGMYTKWTWVLFCIVPVLLAAVRAIGELPGWRGRGIAAGVLLALVAGLAFQVRQAAGLPVLLALRVVGAAVGVLGVWGIVVAGLAWRGRAMPAVGNLGVATVAIAGLAGPWYALVWGALWGRYAHEGDALAMRPVTNLAAGIETIRMLVPFGEVLLGVGVLIALATRRGRLAILASVAGGAVAAWVTIRILPTDPRYLLPLLPLIAGAIVAGWGGLPRLLQGGLLIVVSGVVIGAGAGPLLGWSPLATLPARRGDPLAMPISVVKAGPIPVGLLAASPAMATRAEVATIVEAVRAVCPRRGCQLGWSAQGGGGPLITGREIQAITRWAGLDVEAFDVDTSGRLPGGRVPAAVGLTVCPPVSLARPDPGAVGWTDNVWRSGTLAGGCRIRLTKPAAQP